MKRKFGAYHSLSTSASTFFFFLFRATHTIHTDILNTIESVRLAHMNMLHLFLELVALRVASLYTAFEMFFCSNQDMLHFKKPRKHLNRPKNDRVAHRKMFVVSSTAESFESKRKFKETHSHIIRARCSPIVTLFLSSGYIVIWLRFYCSMFIGVLNENILCISQRADTVHVFSKRWRISENAFEFAFLFAQLQPDLRQIKMIHIHFEDLYISGCSFHLAHWKCKNSYKPKCMQFFMADLVTLLKCMRNENLHQGKCLAHLPFAQCIQWESILVLCGNSAE